MELRVIVPNKPEAKDVLAVSEKVFDQGYNEDLIHQVVVAQLSGERQGTKANKNRSAVSGGGKKPWRQKGTGNARAGTIRSPIWVGGGVTFAAKPRDYKQKVNKKMYRAAMKSILSELARQERLLVVESMSAQTPKTKDFVAKMKELALTKALVVTKEFDDNLYLSSRNVPHIEVIAVADIDPASLVGYEKVVMTADAVKHLEETLG